MALNKQIHSSHNSVTLKTIHASLFTDIAGKKIFYVMQHYSLCYSEERSSMKQIIVKV